MNKILSSLFALIALYACTSAEKMNQHINTKVEVEDLQKDVEVAKKKLLTKHVEIDWYYSKDVIKFRLDSFKNSIKQPMLPNDFSKELSKVVASFGHAHGKVSQLNERLLKDQKKKYKGSTNPISLLSIKNAENRIFLDKIYTKDSIHSPNAELLAVQNYSFADYLKENPNLKDGDGYINGLNQTYIPNYYLNHVSKKIGYQDSITLTLQKNDSVFTQVVKREFKIKKDKSKPKSKPKVDSLIVKKDTIKHQPKKVLTKEEKLKQKELQKHKSEIKKYYAYSKSKKKYNRALVFPNQNDSTTVILDINSFVLGSHKKAYDHIFDSINKLGVKNLILDLRENGGGYPEDINHLFAYLTTKDVPQMVTNPEHKVKSKFTISKRYYKHPNVIGHTILLPLVLYQSGKSVFETKKINGEYYYKSTGKKDYILKEENKFKGNLYVLTSGKTYSAASLISSALYAEGKAIFVGEETRGDYNGTVAGFTESYKLPNSKINVNIPILVFKPFVERELKGRGVMPNKEIKLEFSDLMNQKDPQVDWILSDIESKK